MSIIDNNNPIKPKETNVNNNKQGDESPIMYSKLQFTNSIMGELKNTGATKAQTYQYSQQARSIFDQYDTTGPNKSGPDGYWSQNEANSGGLAAVQNLYTMFNEAIKDVKNTDGVDKSAQTGSSYSQEQVNQMSADLTSDLGTLFKNADFVSFDKQAKTLTIKVTGENGVEKEQTIKLDNIPDEVLSQFNEIKMLDINGESIIQQAQEDLAVIRSEVVEELKNAKTTDDIQKILTEKAGIKCDAYGNTENGKNVLQQMGFKADEIKAFQANMLNLKIDEYAQKGFSPVGNPVVDGDKFVGTLENDKGEQIKIDLKTGQEIKE